MKSFFNNNHDDNYDMIFATDSNKINNTLIFPIIKKGNLEHNEDFEFFELNEIILNETKDHLPKIYDDGSYNEYNVNSYLRVNEPGLVIDFSESSIPNNAVQKEEILALNPEEKISKENIDDGNPSNNIKNKVEKLRSIEQKISEIKNYENLDLINNNENMNVLRKIEGNVVNLENDSNCTINETSTSKDAIIAEKTKESFGSEIGYQHLKSKDQLKQEKAMLKTKNSSIASKNSKKPNVLAGEVNQKITECKKEHFLSGNLEAKLKLGKPMIDHDKAKVNEHEKHIKNINNGIRISPKQTLNTANSIKENKIFNIDQGIRSEKSLENLKNSNLKLTHKEVPNAIETNNDPKTFTDSTKNFRKDKNIIVLDSRKEYKIIDNNNSKPRVKKSSNDKNSKNEGHANTKQGKESTLPKDKLILENNNLNSIKSTMGQNAFMVLASKDHIIEHDSSIDEINEFNEVASISQVKSKENKLKKKRKKKKTDKKSIDKDTYNTMNSSIITDNMKINNDNQDIELNTEIKEIKKSKENKDTISISKEDFDINEKIRVEALENHMIKVNLKDIKSEVIDEPITRLLKIIEINPKIENNQGNDYNNIEYKNQILKNLDLVKEALYEISQMSSKNEENDCINNTDVFVNNENNINDDKDKAKLKKKRKKKTKKPKNISIDSISTKDPPHQHDDNQIQENSNSVIPNNNNDFELLREEIKKNFGLDEILPDDDFDNTDKYYVNDIINLDLTNTNIIMMSPKYNEISNNVIDIIQSNQNLCIENFCNLKSDMNCFIDDLQKKTKKKRKKKINDKENYQISNILELTKETIGINSNQFESCTIEKVENPSGLVSQIFKDYVSMQSTKILKIHQNTLDEMEKFSYGFCNEVTNPSLMSNPPNKTEINKSIQLECDENDESED